MSATVRAGRCPVERGFRTEPALGTVQQTSRNSEGPAFHKSSHGALRTPTVIRLRKVAPTQPLMAPKGCLNGTQNQAPGPSTIDFRPASSAGHRRPQGWPMSCTQTGARATVGASIIPQTNLNRMFVAKQGYTDPNQFCLGAMTREWLCASQLPGYAALA